MVIDNNKTFKIGSIQSVKLKAKDEAFNIYSFKSSIISERLKQRCLYTLVSAF
tara:strand:- start:805 stop:963 length:159 start_codon:yes stop_codon:yes gene_type:complete